MNNPIQIPIAPDLTGFINELANDHINDAASGRRVLLNKYPNMEPADARFVAMEAARVCGGNPNN